MLIAFSTGQKLEIRQSFYHSLKVAAEIYLKVFPRHLYLTVKDYICSLSKTDMFFRPTKGIKGEFEKKPEAHVIDKMYGLKLHISYITTHKQGKGAMVASKLERNYTAQRFVAVKR